MSTTTGTTIRTFRAAVIRTPGGPDSIEIIDVPVVEPGPGQVRVEIAAASVNPVDLGLFRRCRGSVRHRGYLRGSVRRRPRRSAR
jgi:NADPH:quinone reductase-like Zn-dependent oxidoreductase